MKRNNLGSGESRLETGISFLLITGVGISLLLEIVGVTLYYLTYRNVAYSPNVALHITGRDFFTFIYDEITGKQPQTNAIRFMTAGIIVLILTPYIRLIASVIYFAWEKNRKYALITLVVLIIVTLSLTVH